MRSTPNTFERAIRPIGLGRKNALFIGTCRLNEVNPHAYLTDILERIVAGSTVSCRRAKPYALEATKRIRQLQSTRARAGGLALGAGAAPRQATAED